MKTTTPKSYRRFRVSKLVGAAACVAGGCLSSSSLLAAEFIPLGDLPGGSVNSNARDISADGLVVVGRGTTDKGFEAFRWTQGTGLVGLGDLGADDDHNSSADAVSGDGSVVAGIGREGLIFSEAFNWTQGTGMVPLGLPPMISETRVGDMSQDGGVIVGWMYDGSDTEAYRWTEGTGFVGLGHLSGGGSGSFASGTSADGSVIVGNSDSTEGTQAFRWTQATGMVGLGDFDGGAFDSVAGGVSADGTVIVGRGTSNNGQEAFRWTEVGGLEQLGDLAGGGFSSSASAVSGDGSIIVGTGTTVDGSEAFIWDAVNGMRNLREVLETEFGLDLTNWVLSNAVGISEDGMAIIGNGVDPDGNQVAWLARLGAASVPDLGNGGVLLGLGLATLFVARRRAA